MILLIRKHYDINKNHLGIVQEKMLILPQQLIMSNLYVYVVYYKIKL